MYQLNKPDEFDYAPVMTSMPHILTYASLNSTPHIILSSQENPGELDQIND